MSVEKVATGQYEITFAKDVSGCASGDTDSNNLGDVFVQTFGAKRNQPDGLTISLVSLVSMEPLRRGDPIALGHDGWRIVFM